MRFLNASHEPTSLVILRFLFLVIGVIVLVFFTANQLSYLIESEDIYQIEYGIEPLAIPTILFRTIVAPDSKIIDNVKIDGSKYIQRNDSGLIHHINWKENVTDSSYEIQDWQVLYEIPKIHSANSSEVFMSRSVRDTGITKSRSLNNSELSMIMLNHNLNFLFVPKAHMDINNPVMHKAPVAEITIKLNMTFPNDQLVAASKARDYQTDIFIINNSDLINPKNSSEPFDLATIDSGSRFTVKSGTKTKIDFIQSYKEGKDQNETIYDFKFYEQRGTDPTVVEFTLVPRNKPSNKKYGFIVKKEIARRSVSLLQALASIGGSISFFITIFTILFGQRRLKPWGIIQRYFVRNKMLSLLPQSMVSIKSYYDPGFNQESVTDMTFLHMPNPEQCGTASWLPKPIHNPNQHKSSSNDVSRCIPSVLINNEQQNLSAIHPRADKIHELKAMMAVQKARMQEQKVQMQEQKAQMQKQQAQMEAQIKQFTVMTNRLATLEGDTNINNSNIPLDKPTPNSTCLPNTSMAHHSKSFASTSSALPLEARVSNLESFQHRLGTFYLSSDLFKDTSFS